MSGLPAVIQEIGPALRRRLSWAEACSYAELADSSPGDLRRILGGPSVARHVEEKIDRTGRAPPSRCTRSATETKGHKSRRGMRVHH